MYGSTLVRGAASPRRILSASLNSSVSSVKVGTSQRFGQRAAAAIPRTAATGTSVASREATAEARRLQAAFPGTSRSSPTRPAAVLATRFSSLWSRCSGSAALGDDGPLRPKLVALDPVGRPGALHDPEAALPLDVGVGVLDLDDPPRLEVEHHRAGPDRAEAD